MPWTAKDADKHIKGLSPKQARAWAKIANSALARCTADGGADCDASAIRQANGVAKKMGESAPVVNALEALVPLTEVGTELSAKNRKAIRQAISNLQTLLAKYVDDETVDQDQQTEALREAHELLEAELSHDQTRQLLQVAVKAAHNLGLKTYCWIRDVYDDYVVYTVEDDAAGTSALYKRSWSIVDGKVTLGDPTQVQAITTYVSIAESGDPAPIAESAELSGDVIPLVEKAVRKDLTAPIKIISPGWGTSGYYSADVLKRDGPKVFTRGMHMYLDHPTVAEAVDRPERSLKDLAGVLESDARYQDNGADGPGLYTDARLRSDVAPLIEELAPHIGVSIRALGKAKDGEMDGRKGPVVESIAKGMSVDFVTLPGRGGRVLELVEAARTRHSVVKEGHDMPELEEVQRQLTEAQASNRQLAERLILREARDYVVERLGRADIPDITRARLRDDLVKRAPVKDGALDEAAFGTLIDDAVKTEQAYLSEVVGTRAVRGMGSAAPLTEAERTAETEASGRLEGAFRSLGLSESGAKLAAAGRG